MKRAVAAILGVCVVWSPLSQAASATLNEGVSFKCDAKDLKHIEVGMSAYLESIKVDGSFYIKKMDKKSGTLTYTLNTPADDNDTIHFKDSKVYQIEDEDIQMPLGPQAFKTVKTVSRKEIVMALFQHGRETRFEGTHCSVDSFIDHVGIRQNTVLWAQDLEWQWPEGGPAFWHKKYWNKGTPHDNVSVVDAFMDMFWNQKEYGIGCYTATKMVMVQGILDYYARVRPNPKALEKVIERLYSDKDPLVGVEPRKMWSFEKDFDMSELNKPGKILVMQEQVKAMNFVPGDWTYILNTDPVSWEKTGYEGSNAVYLGRGLFDDYYNDNNHSYTYKRKLDEVFNWRHGVFSRSRDAAKIKMVTDDDVKRFSLTPEKGGFVMEYRAHHEFFN